MTRCSCKAKEHQRSNKKTKSQIHKQKQNQQNLGKQTQPRCGNEWEYVQ